MMPLSIMQISSYMIGKYGGMTSVKRKNLWFKSNSAKAKELKGGSGMIIFNRKSKSPFSFIFFKLKSMPVGDRGGRHTGAHYTIASTFQYF